MPWSFQNNSLILLLQKITAMKQKLLKVGISLVLISALAACNNNKEDRLPPDEFKAVLKDMHLAEGAVSANHMTGVLKKDDEVNIYSYVLKKHRISRKVFENNLEYYSRNTNTYLKIYKEIIAELRIADDSLDLSKPEVKKPADSTNLWDIRTEWSLPEQGRTNPITFKLREPEHGIYTLSADIKLFPDDGSVEQRMTVLVKYKDGTSEENSAGNIKKNSEFSKHEVFIRTDPEKELQEITCWVLNHSLGTTEKHALIKNIRLERDEPNDAL